MTLPAVEFDKASIVFGDHPEKALALMDQGASREAIKAQTDQVLGVHDCSLTVHEGEIVVLMGLSGSGKSTLLRGVNGLNPLVRGDIRVNDGSKMVSIRHCAPPALRNVRLNRIAMVFQNFGLLPWRNVAQNIGLGLELAGMPQAQRQARITEQLALVGLSDWADRKVSDLSGGMQQRVGLARAFATQAPILLMDEPFSALDPLIRTKLQEELLDLQKRLKRTIIFVSHDLEEAFKLGNRIALMEGGRIVQIGTAREIIAQPASPYVADFVAHINPINVLWAQDAIGPIAAADHSFSHDTPLKTIMQIMAEGCEAVNVAKAGKIIGTITAKSLLNKIQPKM